MLSLCLFIKNVNEYLFVLSTMKITLILINKACSVRIHMMVFRLVETYPTSYCFVHQVKTLEHSAAVIDQIACFSQEANTLMEEKIGIGRNVFENEKRWR